MDPSTTMLPDLLDDYCTWLRSWGASPSTIKVRESVLARVLVETDATTEGLTAWLARYDAPWTRSTYYSHLRSFFSWAHDAGHLPTDPTGAMRRPKTAKTLPRPLTDDQLEAVLAATTGKVHTYCLLGAYAGLRAHEVAKIAGEDVSAEAIYVYGKGSQAAYVPTHPAIWEAAQDYPSRGLWFPSPSREGRPITATAVSLAVSAVFRDLGIEGSHHRLRHTYGTTLLRRGANLRVVQELMRHQSLAATQVYTAVSAQERTAAILSLTGASSAPDPPRLRAVA